MSWQPEAGDALGGDQELPLELATQIDSVCDEIESQLQRGQQPVVEDYLSRVPPEGHARLLRETVQLLLTYCPPSGLTDTQGRLDSPTIAQAAIVDAAGQIGNYELLEQVGAGGMGVVYRARQRGLNRVVAIKLLPTERLTHDSRMREKLLARFHREATATAQLHHPHIVAIHEVGEDQGRPFYAMQFVDGVTLGQRVSARNLTPTDAARYLATVARAVYALHAAGILHRDLKPNNILIESESDRAMVADFGLAKLVTEQDDVTRTGEFFGTPAYMAPEQITSAARAGSPADVYSLGATLYHALTGRPPFVDASTAGVLHQVLNSAAVPPRAINPGVPRDLESICLKCLEKEPHRRYPSALALAEDLERYLAGLPVLARPIRMAGRLARWSRRNPIPAALLTMVAVSLLGGSAISSVLYLRASSEARQKQLALDESLRNQAAQCRTQAAVAAGPALALPYLAQAIELTAGDSRSNRLDRVRFADAEARVGELRYLGFHGAGVNSLGYDSASRRLLSASDDGTARLWSLDSSRPPIVMNHGASAQAAFASPGVVVTAGFTGTLKLWDANSGQPIRQQQHSGKLSCLTVYPPAGLIAAVSDYKTICIGRIDSSDWLYQLPHDESVSELQFVNEHTLVSRSGKRLLVWDLPGQSVTREFSHTNQFGSFGLTADGQYLLAGASDGTVFLWELATGKQILKETMSASSRFPKVAMHPGGKLAATGHDDGTVHLWSIPLGEKLATFQVSRSVTRLLFSPDGRRLAATNDDRQLFLWDVATRALLGGPYPHGGAPNFMAFVDGDAVATGAGADDRAIRVWHAPAPIKKAWKGTNGQPGIFRADPRRERFLCGNQSDGDLRMLRVSGTPAVTLRHNSPIVAAAFGADDDTVFSATQKGLLARWRLSTKKKVWERQRADKIIDLVPLAGDRLACATDQCLLLCDAANGKILSEQKWETADRPHLAALAGGAALAVAQGKSCRILRPAAEGWTTVSRLALDATATSLSAADGNAVAIRLRTEELLVWRIDANQVTRRSEKRPSVVVRLSPDAERLLVGLNDGGAMLFPTAPNGAPIVLPIAAPLVAADFCAEHGTLLTLAENGAVSQWDALTGEAIWTRSFSDVRLAGGYFCAGGDAVLVIDDKSGTYRWSLPPAHGTQAQIADRSALTSARRYSASQGLVPYTAEELAAIWKRNKTGVKQP